MALSEKDKRAIQNFHKFLAEGGLPSRALYQPKSATEKIKKDLCARFIRMHEEYSLKQSDIAFLTESTKAQISEIMNYRIERFTIDFLVEKLDLLVTRLKENAIDVQIEPVLLKAG